MKILTMLLCAALLTGCYSSKALLVSDEIELAPVIENRSSNLDPEEFTRADSTCSMVVRLKEEYGAVLVIDSVSSYGRKKDGSIWVTVNKGKAIKYSEDNWTLLDK